MSATNRKEEALHLSSGEAVISREGTAHYGTVLPESPVKVIEAGGSWAPVDLKEVWKYRELLYFLTWRDLKVRFKQTALGAAWVVLQPVLMTVIFTVFLGKIARVSTEIPYPLFVYSGLLPWTFFASSVTTSGNSLVGSSNLITKVYFPRVLIPTAVVAARLVDFAISFVIFAGLMIFYRVPLTSHLFLLPLPMVLMSLLSAGVGMWVSALNVKYRDVSHILPVIVQLWMFCSPVIYPLSLVPPRWQLLYLLNPMTGIVQGFRASFFDMPLPVLPVCISIWVTATVLISSSYVFRWIERSFADVI